VHQAFHDIPSRGIRLGEHRSENSETSTPLRHYIRVFAWDKGFYEIAVLVKALTRLFFALHDNRHLIRAGKIPNCTSNATIMLAGHGFIDQAQATVDDPKRFA
jgi:hypothetical protein